MLTFVSSPFLFSSPRSRTLRCRSFQTKCSGSLVVGINQYSHDASIALIDAHSGKLLFAQSKERLTRRKHDGGDVSDLFLHAMDALTTEDESPEEIASRVKLVVANNHHFRILPFEQRLPFQVSMNYVPSSYLSPWNLIGSPVRYLQQSEMYAPEATKVELSHHLAHAFSAVFACPFDRGLVVIMDGMGDSLDDWLAARCRDERHYFCESSCPLFVRDAPDFREFPKDVGHRPGISFREAETAYVFERRHDGVHFSRVYKRWTPENAPSELANHSFEEMDSIGAMYSRVSALIFKDWNNCGKVMGLAPYGQKESDSFEDKRLFIHGHLYDGSIEMDTGRMIGMTHSSKSMADCDDTSEGKRLRHYFEQLAHRMQRDLEVTVADFISNLIDQTGEQNLILAGGVALNSTMNGILSSMEKVGRVYVPPYPGDEGIAVGCAYFGLLFSSLSKGMRLQQTPLVAMPYLGKRYSREEFITAMRCFSPWLQFRLGNSTEEAASELTRGKVVAWFHGRSEFGPRALGNRSLLADPREENMIDHLNKMVKRRESFRPFAPTVMAEYASQWFEHGHQEASPFMSMTKRARQQHLIPAVVHIDGTSRLQTLTEEQNPEFYSLIENFYKRTGIPMVLNTSFNTAGEPIVESPADAIKAFLRTAGIDSLVFPGFVATKREDVQFDFSQRVTSACSGFRSEHVQGTCGESLRTCITVYSRTFANDIPYNSILDEETIELVDGLQLEILETIYAYGTCTVAEICEEVSQEETDHDMDGVQGPPMSDILSRIKDLFHKQLIYETNPAIEGISEPVALDSSSGAFKAAE